MKKTLWMLSALALVGFGFTACSNNCETADDCAEGEYCIESLVASTDSEGEEMEAGEMFCSACPSDCEADSAHPVCVADLHICGAVQTCSAGMTMVNSGGYATCISSDLKTCTSDSECEDGYVCKSNVCSVDDSKPAYKYVRIDDTSADQLNTNKEDPGADIDAVVLIKKSDGSMKYAARVVEYARGDGQSAKDPENKKAFDSAAILGKPDAFVNYTHGGDAASCNYMNDAKSAYTFVSLGGDKGYIIVEMEDEMVPGDTLDVLEIGDCMLKNTQSGNSTKAGSEAFNVSVAVAKESTDGAWNWISVGDKSATSGTGIFSVTLSSDMLK